MMGISPRFIKSLCRVTAFVSGALFSTTLHLMTKRLCEYHAVQMMSEYDADYVEKLSEYDADYVEKISEFHADYVEKLSDYHNDYVEKLRNRINGGNN